MTTIRLYDPSRDTLAMLVELWNEHFGTRLFSPSQFDRLNPENVILVEDAGIVVGFGILLDGGMWYTVFDQLYIRPPFRRFAVLRDVFRFVEQLCAQRGIRWFYGLLGTTGIESEKFIGLLKRRAQWNAQYLGEKAMLCKAVTAPPLSVLLQDSRPSSSTP